MKARGSFRRVVSRVPERHSASGWSADTALPLPLPLPLPPTSYIGRLVFIGPGVTFPVLVLLGDFAGFKLEKWCSLWRGGGFREFGYDEGADKVVRRCGF